MAKVTNPLFSASASGSFSDLLTFRPQAGRHVVHRKILAQSVRSVLQSERAAVYQQGCADWQLLSPEEKAGWAALAINTVRTGFNLFMSDYMLTAFAIPARTYATWSDSMHGSNISLSPDKLTATHGAGYQSVLATIGISAGRANFEIVIEDHAFAVGFAPSTFDTAGNLNGTGDSFSWFLNYGGLYGAGMGGDYYAESPVAGHTLGVAIDMDLGQVAYFDNGNFLGVAFSGLSGTLYPGVTLYTTTLTANFGQSAFNYPISGFPNGVFTTP